MDKTVQTISQCFEKLAEKNIDISESVYQTYIQNMPDVNEHIDVLDTRMKGRMLDQIYRLLLDDVDKDYLEFEARTHRCYGATLERYEGLLSAVKQIFKDQLRDDWHSTDEKAWDTSIKRILADIKGYESST